MLEREFENPKDVGLYFLGWDKLEGPFARLRKLKDPESLKFTPDHKTSIKVQTYLDIAKRVPLAIAVMAWRATMFDVTAKSFYRAAQVLVRY